MRESTTRQATRTTTLPMKPNILKCPKIWCMLLLHNRYIKMKEICTKNTLLNKNGCGIIETFKIIFFLQSKSFFAFEACKFDFALWITVDHVIDKCVANTT